MNPALVQGQHALVYNPMLPPGWIEHRTPTGQPYWYNTITRQTSWLFPSPLPPLAPQEAQPRKKKKQTKKKIPGTNWLFVLTHDGYEFYYDRDTKTSVWEMPEALKEPMEELKKLDEEKEIEKKLKQENEAKLVQKEKEDADNKKRMLEEQEAEQEAKRVKLEQEIAQENGDTEQKEHAKEEDLEATEMTEEDIMWQLQQMAEAEVEETQAAVQTTPKAKEQAKQEPKKPELSEEECLAQFNQLLAERNISPFAIYSAEYPQLMTDPRFSLVPHNKQKALFNKYCNELGEKIKNEKKNKKKPEDEFKDLLVSKVTQKMYWDDFRRKYKDDPRFKAVSVTKEREALFKDHVKHHLGKKRPTDEYMDLLRDTKDIRPGIRWRDAKKILEKDDRYYLVESKIDREDLFRDYLQDMSR
ncbi:uncharacterized protein ATC70_004370 [Mucor velutinosus]|uniref:Transcription elongation regulator 1 n=1 Tax=Mucor velutinosus TaxID=708070 RepID=A0AAN7DRZ9_9FUNG|nr:hypothetical protein ATC70_004370 [Mucor velutinosus]